MDDEEWKKQKKELKSVVKTYGKEAVHAISTVYGDSVPANIALFDGAKASFFSGQAFKGEREYTLMYEDMVRDKATWMGFYDDPRNNVNAERSCGILGTLATLWRQRGDMQQAEAVLDMEEEVLQRYARHMPPDARECYDALRYKYNIIRYNLYLQTNRTQQCVAIFRELATHEFKYKYTFDDQQFAFMLQFIHKPPTLQSLQKCTDAEILRMVSAPLEASADPMALPQSAQERVDKKVCNGCQKAEEFRGDFKQCSACKGVHYCGKECQNKDWKRHKKACKAKTDPLTASRSH